MSLLSFDGATDVTVAVDWTACEGHGLCAELLPERIRLDEWGFPLLDARPLGEVELRHAKRAVAACPVLAFRLRRQD